MAAICDRIAQAIRDTDWMDQGSEEFPIDDEEN